MRIPASKFPGLRDRLMKMERRRWVWGTKCLLVFMIIDRDRMNECDEFGRICTTIDNNSVQNIAIIENPMQHGERTVEGRVVDEVVECILQGLFRSDNGFECKKYGASWTFLLAGQLAALTQG